MGNDVEKLVDGRRRATVVEELVADSELNVFCDLETQLSVEGDSWIADEAVGAGLDVKGHLEVHPFAKALGEREVAVELDVVQL